MKLHELARKATEVLELHDEYKLGHEPALTLVHPKGVKGRFPMKGRLLCVNSDGERVYAVTVADAMAFLSRALKRA